MSTDWNSDTMGDFAFAVRLGFDADDLLANRQGKLSKRQRRKLIRGVIGLPIFMIAFDLVMWKVFERFPKRGSSPHGVIDTV